MRRAALFFVLILALVVPASAAAGVRGSRRPPRRCHLAHRRRLLRIPDRRCFSREDVLDQRAVQERAVQRTGALPAARLADCVALEGGYTYHSGTVADHRFLRVGRDAANVLRCHVDRTATRWG